MNNKQIAWTTFSVAFLLGLVYVFLIPPWQHNDEPGNFEYAWLIANSERWPQPKQYDPSMRRELAASMYEHGFFRDLDGYSYLLSTYEPVWIGISQIDGLPIYFYLASLPLRLVRGTDIVFQMYLCRLVSWLLYLMTVGFALAASQELFNDRLLTWLPPLLMAALPGFVNYMTAVNDDVGATAFATLFIWMSIRAIRRGLTVFTLIGLIWSATLCYYTKRTAWVVLPFAPLIVLLALFRGHRKWIWLGVAGLAALAVGFSFSWSQSAPAYYYAVLNRSLPERIAHEKAPAGEAVIRYRIGVGNVYQTLDAADAARLSGETVTLGFWAWADQPTTISALQLQVNGEDILKGEAISLTQQPTFYAYRGRIKSDAQKVVLMVATGWREMENAFYLDCLVLGTGDLSAAPAPLPQDADCRRVQWGNSLIENPVKNASGERGWLMLKPMAAQFMDQAFQFSVANLWAVFDLQATGGYFNTTISHLFRTFWGVFGFSRGIPLLGNKPYRPFIALTVLAVLGILIALWKDRRKMQGSLVLLLGGMTLAALIMTLFRGAGNWYNYIFTPTARYFLPMTLPVAFFLSVGWVYALRFATVNRVNNKILAGFFSLLLLGLNLWAYFSIISYHL
jgi:hypothetical protein